MWFRRLCTFSILFTAFALAPGLAHLFELLNKMKLEAREYYIVQQIYAGWAFLGSLGIFSLLGTLALTVTAYRRRKPHALPLAALICIVATMIIFWVFTYPVNVETDNWTKMVPDWSSLRMRWEYSHAVSAVLNSVALVSLTIYGAGRQ
jgi:hypothetical protein